MQIRRLHSSSLTRREAIQLLGTGVGVAVAAGCRERADPPSATLSFPDGAIIRTIVNDVPPAHVGPGATLFHEHLQLPFGYYTSPPRPLVQFVPKLRRAGVDEATLHKILVDNPRRFLAFVPKSAT